MVQLKGAVQVALITGEERIVPQGARYYLCTAEHAGAGRARRRSRSARDFAFAAIDEAQLGIIRNAAAYLPTVCFGHGAAMNLILGSDTLKPLIVNCCQRRKSSAALDSRRSASLAHSCSPAATGAVSPSRPSRFALAEMLRRFKGGRQW